MEMYDIGYEEYIYSNGVCVIEWSTKIKEILPEKRIDIKICRGKKENERILYFNGKGSSYEKITKELIKYESTRN